jgi:hypothetical protein
VLEPPYEILELRDGEARDISVVRWALDEMEIHPKWAGAPPVRRIKALRVWVPREEKPLGTDYWDITSQTLIYSLLPFLRGGVTRFRITAKGYAPAKRFQVEVAS